jgi:hypothetical protein
MSQVSLKNNIMNFPQFISKNKEKCKYIKFYLFKGSESFTILGKKHRRLNKENSLEVLAKKFIKYIIGLKTNCINLKDAADKLKIKKRRIYDITNVLEGKYCY